MAVTAASIWELATKKARLISEADWETSRAFIPSVPKAVKIWRESRSDWSRPQFSGCLGYLIGAIVLHGGYNLVVTIWERGRNPFQ